MDILTCSFCGNSDIEPSRYDVDMYDGTDGVTVYDVRMIMNCGECNMHMIAAYISHRSLPWVRSSAFCFRL